jgi:hypothetical protein
MSGKSLDKIKAAVLLLISFLAPLAGAADQREIVRQARQSYYNLPNEGFAGFQVTVAPDWTLMLKQELGTDVSPDHPGLKILNGIHFWFAWDEKGTARLSHQVDSATADVESAEGMNQTVSGIEEVLSGFSQTMGPFLFTSPFPEIDGTYSLDELNDQYRISYKEGKFDILTTMRKTFEIVEMQVKGPEFTASVKPQARSTAKGLLVSGYQADYQSSSGDAYLVSGEIEYKEVAGFQLPAELRVDAGTKGSTHKINLKFQDFQIKKR